MVPTRDGVKLATDVSLPPGQEFDHSLTNSCIGSNPYQKTEARA